MWLITPDGFYSVVQPSPRDDLFQQHGKQGDLAVRARSGRDLETLRTKWCPELGKTVLTPRNRDYGFRAFVPADDLARAAARITLAIDYGNFKDEVASRQGYERASIYSRIWTALLDIQLGPVGDKGNRLPVPIDFTDPFFWEGDEPPSTPPAPSSTTLG